MTDIILSSFLSLFALFAREEQVEEKRAQSMLVNYLRHHFGIRNIDAYLDLYNDMRSAYELSDELDASVVVASICENLHGQIRLKEEEMLLLRLMEFSAQDKPMHPIFKVMAEKFNLPDELLSDFDAFVRGIPTDHVLIHHLEDTDGVLKTLFIEADTAQAAAENDNDKSSKESSRHGGSNSSTMVFTFTGHDTVLLNDVPVLSGAYQVWLQSSVLKGRNGHPVYYSTILEAHNRKAGKTTEHSRQVEFCGRNINFRFPNSDNGMHNLSFTLHSGELLAIMGGSGTGKSTLLSLLNGSVQPQEGTITINGHDISESEAKDLIGYVPQDDLLIEELTVYQNLWYTAKLCFEGMTDDELNTRVMNTLKDLGLDAAKDLRVGSPINKYISGGQRKRLNIALELIREPAVLFLDEPTSGLSSADTEKVINLLKEQTYRGRLIVVNIHQPSSDVYKLFDRLWLLDRGGYPVFDGNPIDAITYFKEAANYADAETSACPTCGNVNPEIVLNIIEEKVLTSSGEFSEERKMTPQEWHELYLKRRPELPTPAKSDVPPSDQKKPNAFMQFVIFLKRNVMAKITNIQYLCLTLLSAPLLAVVCALLTRYAPPEGYSVMDNKNMVSYYFMAVIVATFLGMSGSAEEIIKDCALLKREKFLQLSYSSYIWSKIILMAGVSLLQTFLFILIGNSIMGIEGMFGTWWLILFSTSFLSNLIGLLLSQCLSSVVAIYISIPMLLIPQILLCGLVVDFSDLTPKSTTGNVPIVGDVVPSRWSYEALAVTSFTDNAYEKNFFEEDREKYEVQFYLFGFLNELQSQLETWNDEQHREGKADPHHLSVIHTNLPRLTTFCNMESYSGPDSYAPLYAYLKDAEQLLTDRCNAITLKRDKKMSKFLREFGREETMTLKRNSYNLKLEECVVGADKGKMLNVVGDYIVPNTGLIFLKPQSTCGRAPFYSSEKRIGTHYIKTLWYNLSVIALMCLIIALLLFSDCPGRYLRKSNNS